MASPLTIQPTAAAGKDAFIWSGDGDNYGTNVQLILGDVSAAASCALRNLIAFDVSGVPAGATVTSATLSLWEWEAERGSGPATWDANLHRVLKNWVETEVDWTEYSTGNNWATAGCDNATDRVATASATLTLDGTVASGFVSWSGAGLVADVQAWVNSTANNYGWLLTAPQAEYYSIAAYPHQRFHSSDYTTDTAKCPKLVIEYTEGFTGLTVTRLLQG